MKPMPFTLMAYAKRCIRSDWSHENKGDLEWAKALALAIDKFAKDWVRDNCPGRATICALPTIRAVIVEECARRIESWTLTRGYNTDVAAELAANIRALKDHFVCVENRE